jgi:hypothetical protein
LLTFLDVTRCQIKDDDEVREIISGLTKLDEKGDYRNLINSILSILDFNPQEKSAQSLLKRTFTKYFDKIISDQNLTGRVLNHFTEQLPPNYDKLIIWLYNRNEFDRVQTYLNLLSGISTEKGKIDMASLSALDPDINPSLYEQIVAKLFSYAKNFSYPRMILLYYNSNRLDISSILSNISMDTIKNDLSIYELSLFDPARDPEKFNLIFKDLIREKVLENLDSISNQKLLISFCKQFAAAKDTSSLNTFISKIWPLLNSIENEKDLYEISKMLFIINKKENAKIPLQLIYNKINPITSDMVIKFTWAISSLIENDMYRSEKFLDEVFLYAGKADLEYFRNEILWWIDKGISNDFLSTTLSKYYPNQQLKLNSLDRKDDVDVSFGTYHGLIIGVSDYECPDIMDLENPIRDALKLYEVLKTNYTFSDMNITFITNPTRDSILECFNKLRKNLNENDNLLIFYAGHGWWDDVISQGYWLPTDAETDNPVKWISNSDIRDFIKAIKTKHTLLITDACFGGAIFKERELLTTDFQQISEVYKSKSRRAITSGTIKEVPDRSVFIEYLIKRLNENESEYFLARDLYLNFRAAVINNSPNRQVPVYGIIHNSGDEGKGDFIFQRKKY